MNQIFFLKFLKFCVVGGSGVIVDFAITYLCKEVIKLNKYISNSLGFICAATSNYILNRLWTFGSTDPHITRQYALFLAISLGGLLINNLIIWLLNDKLKVRFSRLVPSLDSVPQRRERLNFYASKLVAIAVVTIWNFLMNYSFTF